MNGLLGHIRWMLRSRRTRRLDAQAMAIADRYGMRQQYIEARKFGFSPLEALEDWDLVTEEDKKKLVDDKETRDKEPISALGLASFVVSVFALIVSIFTIAATVRTSDKTNALTERLNSKEYQMSENLKYELLKVVADLKSIESKATRERILGIKQDYSKEVEEIAAFRTSPGFLIYLHLIDSQKYRLLFDLGLFILTTPSSVLTVEMKLSQSQNVLDILSRIDLEEMQGLKTSDLIKELSSTASFAPKYDSDDADEGDMVKSFLEFLMNVKNVDDDEVELFYKAYNNDTISLRTIEESTENFFTWFLIIVDKYHNEYQEFGLNNLDSLSIRK